ncbi:3'-5' exonuclease [Aquimarina muelleri]|uniref:DNA polymerase III subunit epsilon n=1 Tax=Aquimarina muelleri TaxID=279356 RepID=A0A918JXK6_9FLAO|nr:3'-5' exonuclease [Aquimarina muelleri]MCX2762396.1 3'-5' exonuclease [Aquimarina muelleri]GGX24861.1 DNA polymerase III subunit epsilon [Aquimarina muelleri]
MQFWFKKNKNYPVFWQNYLNLFSKKKQKQAVQDIRFIAFDTETTGFDYTHDRILSIGAIAIKKNAIDVSDQLEIYLDQEIFNKNTVEIHGIRKNNGLTKVIEKKALEFFIDYIGDAILIAHHAEFDKKMINKALSRHNLGTLKNRILDTGILFKKIKHQVYLTNQQNVHYSLDELCNDLKISKSDRHTASGDAFITALAFLKILTKLKKNKKIEISDLFR